MLELRSRFLLVCLHLIVVKSIVCIIKLEPLEKIEACRGNCPINNDLHLPDKWNGFVCFPNCVHEGACISTKCLLIRLHWVAMLDLQSTIVKVTAPEQIVDHKPRIVINWSQLKDWNNKAQVDMDHQYQAVVDD